MHDVDTAVILAAGIGTRLADRFSDRPKGFVRIGHETLIQRSTRLLRRRGIARIVVVAGFMARAYHDLASRQPGLEVVENKEFSSTGSMASLARALETVDEPFLLLESDLFYEPRALAAVLACQAPDVLLASGPTGAGDEVWVEAADGRLRGLSKRRADLGAVTGELVGIHKVSPPLAELMRDLYRVFVSERGHGRMAYETEALATAAQSRPVEVCVVPDLLWGELDDERHYQRLCREVWPAWEKRQAEETEQPATAAFRRRTSP
jgi:2-aminoethylphosphonate-pyruvate transaminase